MFANFLIGLREGLEASLIVAILVAYLVKLDRRDLLPRLWVGVIAAIALSIGAAVFLEFTSQELSDAAAETFAGVMSIATTILITWMIFWMAKNARNLSTHLRGEVDKALLGKSVWALAIIAFVAVIREGLETALFLWTGANATGDNASAVWAAVAGLLVAAGLGYLFYRGALRINLGKLFRWTGALLVVVAAGVLTYGIHEFQEVGILPGEDNVAFDISGTISPDSVAGTFMRGLLSIRPVMTWLEVVAWLAYLVPVMWLFLRISRPAPKPVEEPAKTTAAA